MTATIRRHQNPAAVPFVVICPDHGLAVDARTATMALSVASAHNRDQHAYPEQTLEIGDQT